MVKRGGTLTRVLLEIATSESSSENSAILWSGDRVPDQLGHVTASQISSRLCPVSRESVSRERVLSEREFFLDNLLVRIPYIIVMTSGPASRHGSLNSLFQVALHLPS